MNLSATENVYKMGKNIICNTMVLYSTVAKLNMWLDINQINEILCTKVMYYGNLVIDSGVLLIGKL